MLEGAYQILRFTERTQEMGEHPALLNMDSVLWTQVFLLTRQASYQQSYFLSSFWVFIMLLTAFIREVRWELSRTAHKSWSHLSSSQTRTAANKPVQGGPHIALVSGARGRKARLKPQLADGTFSLSHEQDQHVPAGNRKEYKNPIASNNNF